MNNRFVKISRPRFWIYLFGPYLLGLAVSTQGFTILPNIIGILIGLYFTFPANLLIYGVNDIADKDTDQFNPKKDSYEIRLTQKEEKNVLQYIILYNIPILFLFPIIPLATFFSFLSFFFFGIFYSIQPIRAKAKPILDSFFNILYIFPGLIGYSLYTETVPPLSVTVATTAWCMAMHAYSAIPDIEADRRAGLQTVATYFGHKKTLIFCALLYSIAGGMLFTYWGLVTLPLIGTYLGLMFLSWKKKGEAFFHIYRCFPYINMIAGAYLFFLLIADL